MIEKHFMEIFTNSFPWKFNFNNQICLNIFSWVDFDKFDFLKLINVNKTYSTEKLKKSVSIFCSLLLILHL